MRTIVAMAALVYASASSTASAAFIIPSGSGADAKSTFLVNEPIYVFGSLDYMDPGLEFFPDADVYLVPNQEWIGNEVLLDVFGSPTTIVGNLGGGGFVDELIASPPLLPGEFDIVADVNENGVFDPSLDIIAGIGSESALTVIPEPGTMTLLALCGGIFWCVRKLQI